MRYSRKPKYRIDKTKINVSKEKEISAEDIYKEMLMSKMRRRKR